MNTGERPVRLQRPCQPSASVPKACGAPTCTTSSSASNNHIHHKSMSSPRAPRTRDIKPGNCPLVDKYAEESKTGVNDCGLRSQKKYFWVGTTNDTYGNRCAPLGQHAVDRFDGTCYNLVKCIATSSWDTNAFSRNEDVCQSRRSWDNAQSDFVLTDAWMKIDPKSFTYIEDVGWNTNTPRLTTINEKNSGIKGRTGRFECEEGCYYNYCDDRQVTQQVLDTTNPYHCYKHPPCFWNSKSKTCMRIEDITDVCEVINANKLNEAGAIDKEQCEKKKCKFLTNYQTEYCYKS